MWFALAMGSALFQVLRNMIMKRLGHALDETINVWGRFTFILPFAAIPLLVNGVPPLDSSIWATSLAFAASQIISTLSLAKALHVSEISLVTPLWKLSVLFLVVWGFFALDERPTPLGLAGILVLVAGVYVLNVERARVSLWAPLSALVTDPGQRWTMLSAFFFAPSVVFIKQMALASNPVFAIFLGYLVCSLCITPYALYRSARHFSQVGRYWKGFVGLGLMSALSTWAGTTAYTMTVSSYVEAAKQVEILFALVIGYLAFKEGARVRVIWPGALILLLGMIVLRLAD